MEAEVSSLEEELHRANQRIADLMHELARLERPVSIVRLQQKPQQVFAPSNVTVWALPREGFMPLRTIPQGCVFQVLEAANPRPGGDDPTWFYVEVPWIGDSPVNTQGWVRADDTVPYGPDIESQVRCPVTMNPGTVVYEVEDFSQISSSTGVEAERIMIGIIHETRDDFSLVTIGAGLSVWVKTDELNFPKPRQ